jgi:arabinoxylan arabinofuranohydrolase
MKTKNMKRTIAKGMIFASLLACVPARADSVISPDYLFNSDPTLHTIGDRLWMFTSHDQTSENFIKGNLWDEMYDYHAISTDDFRTWVDHGSIFSIHDVAWSKGNAVWDGDAGIAANGKYYAYAPFDYQIGVLVADHPAGPYKDALGRPLIGKHDYGIENKAGFTVVSPSVIFIDNKPYLLFGWGALYVARLKPNMIELDENPVVCKIPADYVESPIITRINGKFYLTYSSGGLWGENGLAKPQIKYCIADSIYGPYANAAVLQDIQINPDGQGFKKKYAGNAHQGVEFYKGQWYFAYHRDSKNGSHRHACITKLTVNPDGTLGVIDPNTDKGVVDGPINFVLDAFAPYKREAEEFHARHDAEEEKGIRQDFHFKMKDGGWLRFNRMDFGAGAGGVKMEVSCENTNVIDAGAEFRLDTADGPVIAKVRVNPTGGKTKYVVLTDTANKVSGIHDLFIVARGKGGDAAGQLFNINWFTFIK